MGERGVKSIGFGGVMLCGKAGGEQAPATAACGGGRRQRHSMASMRCKVVCGTHLAKSAGRHRPAGATARSAGPLRPAALGCGMPAPNSSGTRGQAAALRRMAARGGRPQVKGARAQARPCAGQPCLQARAKWLHARPTGAPAADKRSAPGSLQRWPHARAGGGSAPPARRPVGRTGGS